MRDEVATIARARVEVDDRGIEPLRFHRALCRSNVLDLRCDVPRLDERFGEDLGERAILDDEQNPTPCAFRER